MKNKLFLLFFLYLCQFQTNAQNLGWNWAKSAGGNIDDIAKAICTDTAGNIYITGYFSSPSLTVGSFTLNRSGNGGIFIIKYDSIGNVLWAKTQGGIGGAGGTGISTDVNGNVFVTGGYTGQPITFGTYTLNNFGVSDIFIVKFDTNGNAIWAKSGGGTGIVSNGITTDYNGNSIIVGYFYSSTIVFGTFTLTNAGVQNNIFTVKYDSSGYVLWAKSAGGANPDIGNSITSDSSGNILISGYFASPTIVFGTYTLNNSGGWDIFTTKYDSNGNVVWANSFGGNSGSSMNDFSKAITTDINGNVYITGTFQSPSISFGTYTLLNTNSPSPGLFIVKYNPSGNITWAKYIGNGGTNGICIENNTNIFVTGFFGSPTISIGTNTLTNNGSTDFFIIKYDGLGNVISSISGGGALNDNPYGICSDSKNNVFVTGAFNSQIVGFGRNPITNYNPSNNTSDIFVAKLTSCTIAPQSPLDITPGNNKNVCTHSTISLTVSGAGVINWFASPISTLALLSGSVFVTSGLNSGNYTYYAEAYTCTNSISRTAITVSVDACLGVKNPILDNHNIFIFPNPIQDKMTIEISSSNIKYLEIFNSLGQVVLSKINHDTSESLDVKTLLNGVYFVKVELENSQRIFKVIKN